MEGAGLRPAAAFRAHITGGTRRAVISFARRINDVGHDNGWAQRARDLAQSAGEAADRRPGMARKRTRRPKKAGTERNEEAEEDVHAARPSPAASTSAPSPPSDPPLAQQRTHTPPGRGSVALTKADIDGEPLLSRLVALLCLNALHGRQRTQCFAPVPQHWRSRTWMMPSIPSCACGRSGLTASSRAGRRGRPRRRPWR